MNSTDSGPETRKRKTGWSVKILILLVSLAAALSIVETYLSWRNDRWVEKRLQRYQPAYTRSLHTRDGTQIGTKKGILKLCLDTYLGYRNLPDQKTDYFTINRHGFRGREIAREKSDRKRIIVLGGSTAFGTGLNSDAETFAAHLESRVPNSEVINAAVIGHHSKQELVYILSELVAWKPDLIIAIDGWNDWIFNTATSNIFVKQMEDMLELSTAMTTNQWYKRVTKLPRILFPATLRWAHGGIETEAKPKEPEDPDEVRKAFANNVTSMHRVARTFGSRFLSVLQVDSGDRSLNMYQHEGHSYIRFCNHAGKHFDLKGVEWIDMNRHRKRFEIEMFMDRVHLTSEGYRVMAEVVAEKIQERNLLAPLPE